MLEGFTCCRTEIVAEIVERRVQGKMQAQQTIHQLFKACRKGKIRKVREILAQPDANTFINEHRGIIGKTPLHEATENHKLDIVEVLLDCGADVNAVSNGDYTALHIAATNGDTGIINLLLSRNADIKKLDEFQRSPLQTAKAYRRKSAERLLKTAELKALLVDNFRDFKKMIYHLKPGADVTDTCFNECLEIAVQKNLHLAAGFIILRIPSNAAGCLQKAIDIGHDETAVMLMLCLAAMKNEITLLQLICRPSYETQARGTIPGSNNQKKPVSTSLQLTANQPVIVNEELLERLRIALRSINYAVPVSFACYHKQYESAGVLLKHLHLFDHSRLVDWHGLGLTLLQPEWVDLLQHYSKLNISNNYLTNLPGNLLNLKSLSRLELQDNRLEKLPELLFSKLPLLKTLNLAHNKIQKLPNIEKWSTSLVNLDLSYNKMEEFPEEVNGISLTMLNIAHNNFDQVPLGICKIKTLENLDFSGNEEIHELPLDMGRLTKLSTLPLNELMINDPPQAHQLETKQLIQLLRARLRSAESFFVMKLMIIGRSSIGKTTLMYRLMGFNDFNDDVATQGINIKEFVIRRNQTFTFRVWDFAGEEDYYATHQCFLSECSLYLLLWDMQIKEKGVKDLEHWLDTLATRVENCSLILVGTKLDLVKARDISQFEDRMIAEMDTLLASKRIYQKIKVHKVLHFSSNVRYKDFASLLENLKKNIYDAAEVMTTNAESLVMGEQVPLSYLKLADKLNELQKLKQREKELPILNREEFFEVARNLDCQKDSIEDDEIEHATSFLHRTGTILHYNDPNENLKELYFISPSWLCRLMAKVITVKQANPFFDENGILKIDNIKLIVGEKNEEFPKDFYPKYLRLLNRFQIACRIADNEILVPSKLPPEKETKTDEDISRHNLLYRYQFFPCIPYGFWERLICRLIFHLGEMLAVNQNNESDIQENSESTSFNYQSEDQNKDLSYVCKPIDRLNSTRPIINGEHEETGIRYVNMMDNTTNAESISGPEMSPLFNMPDIRTTNSSDMSQQSPVESSQERSSNYNKGTSGNSVVSNASGDSDKSASINGFKSESSYATAPISQPEEHIKIAVDIDLDEELKSNIQHSEDWSVSGDNKHLNIYEQNSSDSPELENDSCQGGKHLNQEQINAPCNYVPEDHDSCNESTGDYVSLEEERYASSANNTNNAKSVSSDTGRADSISPRNGNEREKYEIDLESNHFHDMQVPTVNDNEVEIQEHSNLQRDPIARIKPYSSSVMVTAERYVNTQTDGSSSVEINGVHVEGTAIKDENGSNEGDKRKNTDNTIIEDLDKTEPFRLITEEKVNKSVLSQQIQQNEQRQEHSEKGGNLFDKNNNDVATEVDILALLGKTLTFWRKGVIFNNEQLYFSVQEMIINEKCCIEIKVSRNKQGNKVLCYIIDHIRTLVKEWFPQLSGNDGRLPYITQKAACPICIAYNVNPPHMFDIQQVFSLLYQKNGSSCRYPCEKRHVPQLITLNDLCPEILLEDIPTKFKIKPDDVHFKEDEDQKLGKQGVAKVFRGKFKNVPSAVKVYKFDGANLATTFDTFLDVRQEIIMLSKLSGHRNIIEFLGYMFYPKLCTVVELADKGSLGEALYEKKINLDRLVVYQIMKELLSALTFMHSRNIIHRDNKSDNIVLFSTNFVDDIHVKLIDFGTSSFMCPTGLKVCIGTDGFIAPEIYDAYRKDEYTSKVDIFSSGMVAYELLTRRPPFHDYQKIDISAAVIKGERPGFNDVFGCMHGYYTMTEMMLRMWQDDSTQRPTAEQATELISKPVFQLLYSKKALEVPQNPLRMCYVKGKDELWILCDEKRGCYVVIYNIISAETEVLNIDGGKYGLDVFNLVNIDLLDDTHIAVVLRSLEHDLMIIFSTEGPRKVISCRMFTEFVSALSFSEKFGYFGHENGHLSCIPKANLLNDKVDPGTIDLSVNETGRVKSILVISEHLVLAIGKYIYQYNVKQLSNDLQKIQLAHASQPIREMISNQNKTQILVSFQSSPVIVTFDAVTLDRLTECDSENIIKSHLPAATRSDIRISCMCTFADVLWVGTGSGHIVTYQYVGNTFSCLHLFQPYELEMRILCAIELRKQTEDKVKYLVCSSGKKINKNIFGQNSFIELTQNPLCVNYARDTGRESPVIIDSEEAKVMLIWQGIDAKSMTHL